MSIEFSCDNCFRSYKVKDSFAGRKIRCKECSTPMQVPSESAGAIEEYFEDGEWGNMAAPTPSGGGLPPVRGAVASSRSPRPKKKKKKSMLQKNVSLPSIGTIFKYLLIAAGVGFCLMFVSAFFAAKKQVETRYAYAANPTWRNYTFPGQPLSAEMPDEPKIQTQQTSVGAVRLAVVDFRSDRYGTYAFSVTPVSIPPNTTFNVQGALEAGRTQAMKKLTNGQLINESVISIRDPAGNQHPGRAIHARGTVSGTSVDVFVNMYIVGPKIVQTLTIVEASHVGDFQPNRDRFNNSLKVLEPIDPI